MKTITENTVQAGQGRMNIKEIARVAGVSPATISRVLNGSGYVKEETKKKVMAAVEKNNYTPSLIARSLSGRDSFSIGVILPSASQRDLPSGSAFRLQYCSYEHRRGYKEAA